jgi:quercetin dioxygenase-like cupin family protein
MAHLSPPTHRAQRPAELPASDPRPDHPHGCGALRPTLGRSPVSGSSAMDAPAKRLAEHPIHLGLGATATPQPTIDGVEWYQAYGERHGGDGAEGRLVSVFTFDAPWSTWEMHPRGAEVVLCLEGTVTLVQEIDGAPVPVVLEKGEYAINPPGVWHTADCDEPVTALFITAGLGTEIRPR